MSEAAARGAGRSGSGIAGLFSDDRLVRRASDGDEAAFGAIFRRYHQDLYRYCLAIVGEPHDAHDALQNTMVKVLRGLPGETRKIELKPWLYRIAHNEAVEVLRRRRPTAEIDPEQAASGPGLAAEAEVRERLRRLIGDLDELPERQRGALVMRELAGLGFAEIGAALGTSPAVARQTVYEARLSLGQMDAGREMTCETVTRALSDADGRVTRRRDIRAHLRTCAGCRGFRDGMGGRERDLAALSPLPAVAAAGLLQGLLGGHGGLAGTVGGGAAKALGLSAAVKATATVAVVAAIGVTAADRGGLVDAGLPGGGDASTTRSDQADGRKRGGVAPAATVPPATGTRAAGILGGLSPAARAARRAGGELGGSRATAGIGEPGRTAPGAAPAPGSALEHPHGRGHEKQLPAVAAHGQQTAAGHKAAQHGGGAANPAHPAKPAHPATPAHPAKPSPTPKPTNPAASDPAAAPSPPPAPPAPGASAGKASPQVEAVPEPEAPAAAPAQPPSRSRSPTASRR
jgi:RNA polymerase sigma factor (sigma-70 family)